MTEWGIFNDESPDYTSEEAVESGFWSKEEAEQALTSRYKDDDDCHVHECEEPDEDDADDSEDY